MKRDESLSPSLFTIPSPFSVIHRHWYYVFMTGRTVTAPLIFDVRIRFFDQGPLTFHTNSNPFRLRLQIAVAQQSFAWPQPRHRDPNVRFQTGFVAETLSIVTVLPVPTKIRPSG